MPLQASRLYAIRVEFPHGPAILSHRNIDARTEAERAFVLREIRKALASNPDIQFDPRNVWKLESVAQIAEMTEKLKAEIGDRPLATELGLDHPNRLLVNPEISRNLAGESVPG